MKRTIVSGLILFFLLVPVFGENARISVLDLNVQSENPQYKFVGKGIAEMVAVELRKSAGITLIEREKRSALLDEMEFSLSDMADSNTQVKIGQLLSADYMLAGEIVDMVDAVLITMRMVKVATGEVVWNEMLTEKITRYDYITGFFTKSILNYFNFKIAGTTNQKIETKTEKDQEAVIAFSNAIDFYDKKDNAEAKKELEKAKTIDPKNEAVNLYTQKLAGLSPKFRVELERYTPTVNPATLGMLDRDEFYYWGSMPVTGVGQDDQNEYGGGLYGHEVSMSHRLGYMFPLITNLGLAVEMIWSHQDNSVNFPYSITAYDGSSTATYLSCPTNIGGNISIGYRLIEPLSIGASFHFFNNGNLLSGISSAGDIVEGNYFALDGGFLFQTFQEQLLFDMHAVYTNMEELYYEEADTEIVSGNLPLLIDSTLTGSLLNRTLFLACKGIGEIYLDARGGFFLRVIPIAEYWLLPFIAVRGGYEFSYIDQAGKSSIGNGFLAGLSYKFQDFSLNANFSYRNRPLHVLPGHQIDQGFILIGLTYSPGLLKR